MSKKDLLLIRSKGLIEEEAITLIGASTKKNDKTKIGMFGSGLPYSIASMVRQNYGFMIFSGEKEIKIDTQPTSFGGMEFNRILVNNKETSFTDTMGEKDWQGAWPFIRELFSNAIDEDENAIIDFVDKIEPNPDYTSFYIYVNEEIEDIAKNIDNYFIYKRIPKFYNKRGAILSKESKHTTIYRKGIAAFIDENVKSIYDYNLLDIDINESRVISNPYEAKRKIGELIESCDDLSILQRIFRQLEDSNTGYIEHDAAMEYYYGFKPNPVLSDYIMNYSWAVLEGVDFYDKEDVEGRRLISKKWCLRFLKHCPKADILGLTDGRNGRDKKPKRKEVTNPKEDLTDSIIDALEILKSTPYKSRLESPVKVFAFSDKSILGQADIENKIIMISETMIDYSAEEVAKVIIEEQEHIHTEQDDMTREFQNHLFNIYYKLLLKWKKKTS